MMTYTQQCDQLDALVKSFKATPADSTAYTIGILLANCKATYDREESERKIREEQELLWLKSVPEKTPATTVEPVKPPIPAAPLAQKPASWIDTLLGRR